MSDQERPSLDEIDRQTRAALQRFCDIREAFRSGEGAADIGQLHAAFDAFEALLGLRTALYPDSQPPLYATGRRTPRQNAR